MAKTDPQKKDTDLLRQLFGGSRVSKRPGLCRNGKGDGGQRRKRHRKQAMGK